MISSVDRLGNAGSKTPIGILRSVPADAFSSPDFDTASAVSAVAVRGASRAPANRLVVVRKSLRLREFGADFGSMEYPLAVRFCRSETLCRASIIQMLPAKSPILAVRPDPIGADVLICPYLTGVVDNNACFPTCSCAR